MTGKEKLQEDLRVLEAMAEDMDAYLRSDVLFWKLYDTSLPRLTLGGYLMREHRLIALADDLLSEVERQRLSTAVSQFQEALVEKTVRFEQKAQHEVDARIRQWTEYLRDAEWEEVKQSVASYATAAEVRTMLAALLNRLQEPQYQLDEQLPDRVQQLDMVLRPKWEPGDFVWPDSWQPAYPKNKYWWLYGHPRQE